MRGRKRSIVYDFLFWERRSLHQTLVFLVMQEVWRVKRFPHGFYRRRGCG